MRHLHPFFLAFLAACDPSVLAFDPAPLDAGLYPVGGGSVDERLAGCTWTRTDHYDDASDDAYDDAVRYRIEATYDLWGRRTAYELRYSSAHVEDSLEYAETWVFDAGGCPVSGEVSYRDDMWGLHEDSVTRACDLQGNLTAWKAGGYDERYRNTYGVLGKLVAREELYDDEDEAFDRVELTWGGDRITEWVERDPESGEEEWRESRTFNLDGWVTSVDLYGDVGTYTYDAAGRLVETDWSEASYTYASVLAAFPDTFTFADGSGTIRVDCGL